MLQTDPGLTKNIITASIRGFEVFFAGLKRFQFGVKTLRKVPESWRLILRPVRDRQGIITSFHEQDWFKTPGGPPGSRSQRLRIKRKISAVVVRRSRRACRLFSRNLVVTCQSRLAVLQKYEA